MKVVLSHISHRRFTRCDSRGFFSPSFRRIIICTNLSMGAAGSGQNEVKSGVEEECCQVPFPCALQVLLVNGEEIILSIGVIH